MQAGQDEGISTLSARPAQPKTLLGGGGPHAPGPHPGMVLEWQQRDGAWFALVAYYFEGDGVLVQQWLSADPSTRIG